MYKLIIVEDEDIVRSGLKNGTDWYNLGFQVVGTAKNGIEALELVDNTKPDVVLTDVRMPDMDGIELMRILKYRYPHMEIVILSGYSDFEYARSAVKYNAYEFLTKPIDDKEFKMTFKELKQKMKKKRQDYTSKNFENTDKDRLRDVFLSTMLTKPVESEFIRKSLNELDIKINENSYCINVVQIDSEVAQTTDEMIVLFRNKCAKHIYYYEYPYVFMGRKCFIFMSKRQAAYYDFKRDAEIFRTTLTEEIEKNYSGMYISIGISRLHREFSNIYTAANEAQTALNFRFYLGGSKVIPYKNITEKKLDSAENKEFEWHINGIVQMVLEQNAKERTIRINKFFDLVRQVSLPDVTYIRIKIMEIFVVLDNKLKHKNISLELLSKKDILYGEIFKKYTLDSLKDWFKKKLETINTDLKKHSTKKANSIVQQVQQYIYDNLKDKIYLNDIAEAVHMSPTYLSTTFTKETGLNLSKYIIYIKVKKAQEYLGLSDMRIQDISEELGFSDYRYFCTVFKKETGQTPLNYRAQNHR